MMATSAMQPPTRRNLVQQIAAALVTRLAGYT